MKKNKLLYFSLWIGGLIILMAGVFLFVLGGQQESGSTKLLLKIIGVIIFFLGDTMLVVCLIKYYKGNKAVEIAEKDERNIAIRGKAAQSTCLITIFLLLAVMIVFLFMELFVAALIIGVAMMVSSFLQILLIAYYEKKSCKSNEDLEDLE